VDHEDAAKQAFPWRQEQAAFVAGGEHGPLPNETVWEVVSELREVTRKGRSFLELDLRLGGGLRRGKARFSTRDAFGKLEASAITHELELGARTASSAGSSGLALNSEGKGFSGFDKGPFFCEREVVKVVKVVKGCGRWVDRGVKYIAVSLVSFDNVLKTAYGRK
jgi:hypothetical protein